MNGAGGTFGGVPIQVGTVLGKKYRVERLIGEGGTGLVIGATHIQLEQRVAIKVLRTALASDEIRTRFEREAKAIGKIHSEHVVVVLDVGTLDDGAPFMVMEHLEGRNLARVLREDGPMDIEDAVDCMLQLCEALEEAHANGIVHRDLKPANLFLTRREDGAPHIKVVDFGISKILDKNILGGGGQKEMTSAFTVLGSPRYMAPEQLRNSKEVDGRADLWSVGTVLFQLITGKHAFDAENNTQASVKILASEPAKLRDFVKNAAPQLDAIVARCLEKDAANRWQSAAQLAGALRPFASERARESIDRQKEAREAPSLQIALSLASTSDRPPPVTRSTIPPMPEHHHPPPSSQRPAAAMVAPSRRPGSRASTPGMAALSPVAPRVPTPVPTGPAPTSVQVPIPKAPPLPSGREVITSPRVTPPMAPPPVSSPPAPGSTSEPPMIASVRRAYGRDPGMTMKLAIAVGGIFVVLIVFGVLTLAKSVAEKTGIVRSEATEPPSMTAAAMPAAPAPSPKIRDKVTVPLDAAAPLP